MSAIPSYSVEIQDVVCAEETLHQLGVVHYLEIVVVDSVEIPRQHGVAHFSAETQEAE